MTYAPSERAFYDADSHIMELPNFLIDYADPSMRDDIPPVSYSASLVTDEEVDQILANSGRHTTEHVEAQIALGDQLIVKSKEIQALGAFDRGDRSTALEILGFRKQLVFATHSVATPSEMLREQMAFTPYVFEDIGTLTDQSYDDIYLFSSDYSHVEGGRDPIGRFEKSLGPRTNAVRERFYAENFLKIFPGARVHVAATV